MKNEFEVWSFSDNKKESDYLFQLVERGLKTATCELYLSDEQLDSKNSFSILKNWNKTKSLKIKTYKKYKTKFKDVTSKHAFLEGEGDKTLDYWRVTHRKFFERECKRYDIKFNEDIEIVCEEFKVVK